MNFTEDSSAVALSEISRDTAVVRSRDDVDSHYGTSGHRANLITIAFSIPFTIYVEGPALRPIRGTVLFDFLRRRP